MSDLETRVAECVKEYAEIGFWRTCSGCHDSEAGHDVGHYPFNQAFDCKLGSGCSECGGIGAVWDTTDYLAMLIPHQLLSGRDWSSDAERAAAKSGQLAALAYSETGGGPIGTFLAGLTAYRETLSKQVEPAHA